jgi:hypothetical protein
MAKNLKTLKTNEPLNEPKIETSKIPIQTAKPASTVAAAAGPVAAAMAQPVRAASAAPKPSEPRVSLQFVNPAATKVCVVGSFNGWKPDATPLTRTGNGQWVGNLTITPGRHEYLFVVDGQWVPDPKAPETVPNPFGGRNSVLVVSM